MKIKYHVYIVIKIEKWIYKDGKDFYGDKSPICLNGIFHCTNFSNQTLNHDDR